MTTAIIGILESDFKESKNDMNTCQEDLQFLKIMEDGIKKTENEHCEMPLPFKMGPLLPDNRSVAITRLEHQAMIQNIEEEQMISR